MKESEFNKRIVEICGDNVVAQYEYFKKFRKFILQEYDAEYNPNKQYPWKLFRTNRESHDIEDGIYMTLRVSSRGIYQFPNTWSSEQNKWLTDITDGSYTIMYKDIEPFLN